MCQKIFVKSPNFKCRETLFSCSPLFTYGWKDGHDEANGRIFATFSLHTDLVGHKGTDWVAVTLTLDQWTR